MVDLSSHVCKYLITRDGRLTKEDRTRCEELYKLTLNRQSELVNRNLLYRLEDILIDYKTS